MYHVFSRNSGKLVTKIIIEATILLTIYPADKYEVVIY